MFTSLSNYIFGASTSGAEEETPVTEATSSNHDDHPNEAKLQLRTSAEDSEWVLVDKAGSMDSSMEGSLNSTHSDTNTPPDSAQHTRELDIYSRCVQDISRLSPPQGGSGSSSRASSGMSSPVHIVHPSLGESWLVTPPPCFTAGAPPVDMASSPLEDLLIEHPSMSVYGDRGRPHSQGHDSDNDDDNSTVKPASSRLKKGPQAGRAVVSRPHHPRALLSTKASLQAQVAATRSMQRAHKKREHRQQAKHTMQRNNRVMEHNSHPRRLRRRDHVLTPSGRSNDRKVHH